MADNVIHLKIVIDGKEVSAELKEADKLLGSLKKNAGGIPGEAKKIGASKQDIGRFSGEILGAVGATGKLGSHLNTLASGLLTGGFIGGAFAGAAALISAIVGSMDEWKDSIEAVKSVISIESDDEKFIIKAEEISAKLKIAREERQKEYERMSQLSGSLAIRSDELKEKELEEARAQWNKWRSIIKNLEEEEKQYKDKAEMLDLINKKLKGEEEVWTVQGKTVKEINKQIEALNKNLGDQVPRSEKYKEINSEIEKLQKLLDEPEVKEARPEVPDINFDDLKFTEEDITLPDIAYGNLLDYTRLTKEQELQVWYDTEKKKVEAYENSTEMMLALNKERADREKDLAVETAQVQMEAAITALSYIAGAIGEHTLFGKMSAAAMAYIKAEEAAAIALTAGPFLGPIMAVIIRGLGIQSALRILAADTPKATGYATGYATGGFAMFGERGPEIVAPVTDYAKGQALLVAHTISTLRSMMGGGALSASGGGSMQELITEIRSQNTRIEKWQRDINFRFKSGEFVSGSNKALAKYNDLKF